MPNQPNEVATTQALITIDCAQSEILRDEQRVKLDPLLVRLIEFLLAHPNQLISRQALSEQVWHSAHTSDQAINRSISILRKALSPQRDAFIITIPKQGYKFTIDQSQPLSYIPSENSTLAAFETTAKKAIQSQTTAAAIKPQLALQVEQQQNESLYKKRWTIAGLIMLACTIVLFTFMFKWPTANEVSVTQTFSNKVAIAVLPFETNNHDNLAQNFVDGLNEVIVNGLTRLQGIVVVDWPGHAKNNEISEHRALAKQINVRYLIKGKVRKIDNTLRVTIQLLDNQSGEYLFSTVLERQIQNVFVLQDQISAEVASALKLSLHHPQRDKHYLSALNKLDHTSVEKLVIARGQIRRNQAASIQQALEHLQMLNQNYPQTPEIMGLLAFAYSIEAGVGAVNKDYDRQIEVELAKRTLALDSRNLDAMMVMYYYYDDFADLRDQAVVLTQQMVNTHPGRQKAYKLHFLQLLNNKSRCAVIKEFIQQMPLHTFSRPQVEGMNITLSDCAIPHQLSVDKMNEKQRKFVNQAIARFGLSHDNQYVRTQKVVTKTPNQRNISQIYRLQLAIGAMGIAKGSGDKIDHSKGGYWSWLATVYGYLHQQFVPNMPGDFSPFVKEVYRNSSDPYFVAALIKEASDHQNPQILIDYLSNVPAFKINIINYWESVGLMALQYNAGQTIEAQQTAQKLYQKLQQYKVQHPQDFKFWSLGRYQLISALYANKMTAAQQILANDFANNEAWWTHDIGFTQSLLSPYKEQPVVKQYLQQIKADAKRARQKFDLL